MSFTMPQAFMTQDNSRSLLNTCIAFIVLETIFVSLLLISRRINTNKTGTGMPLLMVQSYVLCMSKIALALLMIKIGGAGKHMWSSDMPTLTSLFKLLFALQIVCPMTTSMIKLAVLWFFYHIFGVQSKNYRIAIYAAAAIVASVLIVQVIIPIANCKPIAFNWDISIQGKCSIEVMALWRYLSIPNIVTDLIMLAIPVPALYKLRVSLYRKLGLAITFAICIFGVAVAVIRFIAFYNVKDFSDISYNIINPMIWTIIESGIYLIAGVMPALHPLITKVFWDGKVERLLSRTLGISRTYGRSSGFEALEKGGSEGSRGSGSKGGSVEERSVVDRV